MPGNAARIRRDLAAPNSCFDAIEGAAKPLKSRLFAASTHYLHRWRRIVPTNRLSWRQRCAARKHVPPSGHGGNATVGCKRQCGDNSRTLVAILVKNVAVCEHSGPEMTEFKAWPPDITRLIKPMDNPVLVVDFRGAADLAERRKSLLEPAEKVLSRLLVGIISRFRRRRFQGNC